MEERIDTEEKNCIRERTYRDPDLKKEKIYYCIRKFISENGYPPSLREICLRTNVGAPSTVSGYIDRMVREGTLKRNGRQRRSVVPADLAAKPDPEMMKDSRRVHLTTADGGSIELDYSITMNSDHQPVCSFEGILDCSHLRRRVSRIVSCKTEE